MKLYCCVTSIPPRAHRLSIIINSLLNGDVIPDKIIITLCEKYNRFDEKYDMKYLEEFKNNDKIEINIIEEDLGSCTKLIGSLDKILEDEKDNLNDIYLISIDDDLCYTKGFIKEMKKCIKKEPNTHWTGFSEKKATGLKGGINVGFSADGFSFRLSELINFKEYCLKLINRCDAFTLHDDLLFSSFLLLNNKKIKRMGVPSRTMKGYPRMDKYSITMKSKNDSDPRGVIRDRRCFGTYLNMKNNNELNKYILEVSDIN